MVLVAGTWLAADYYFNIAGKSPEKKPAEPSATAPIQKEVVVAEKQIAVADGFKAEAYKDERYGFEFQYPVFAKNDPQCAKLEKTDTGVSLGIFSLSVVDAKVPLADFISSELEGMNIDSRADIIVAGMPATKIDYVTAGMGFNGSSVFFEKGNKIFEFGLLANEPFSKCGGTDDYEDQVYQLVILTLKTVN